MKKLSKPTQVGPVISGIQVDQVIARVLRVPLSAKHPDGLLREVKLSWSALDANSNTLSTNQTATATDEHGTSIMDAMSSNPFDVAEAFVQQNLDTASTPPTSPQGTPSA
jgi:hypothetical protein